MRKSGSFYWSYLPLLLVYKIRLIGTSLLFWLETGIITFLERSLALGLLSIAEVGNLKSKCVAVKNFSICDVVFVCDWTLVSRFLLFLLRFRGHDARQLIGCIGMRTYVCVIILCVLIELGLGVASGRHWIRVLAFGKNLGLLSRIQTILLSVSHLNPLV